VVGELYKPKEINRKDCELIQNIRKKDVLLIAAKVEFTPIKMICKFIENCGDPLVYLKAISMSYPEHPFCRMLIECETVGQFLNKLKPLEAKLPILFLDHGKKWLSELFEVSKGFVRVECESGTQNAADIVDACV
jgi:hypothetical protein